MKYDEKVRVFWKTSDGTLPEAHGNFYTDEHSANIPGYLKRRVMNDSGIPAGHVEVYKFEWLARHGDVLVVSPIPPKPKEWQDNPVLHIFWSWFFWLKKVLRSYGFTKWPVGVKEGARRHDYLARQRQHDYRVQRRVLKRADKNIRKAVRKSEALR